MGELHATEGFVIQLVERCVGGSSFLDAEITHQPSYCGLSLSAADTDADYLDGDIFSQRLMQ